MMGTALPPRFSFEVRHDRTIVVSEEPFRNDSTRETAISIRRATHFRFRQLRVQSNATIERGS